MTKGQQPKDIFDVKRIREIIELMEEHDLSAVDLQQGDEKIKLNRGSVSPVYSAPPPVAAPAAAPAAAADSQSDAGTITVNAPMVGTFYARANPESDPFVKVGDMVFRGYNRLYRRGNEGVQRDSCRVQWERSSKSW